MVPGCFYQVVDGTRVHVISLAYADKCTIILHRNDITAAKSVADDVIDRCYNACRGPIASSHDNGRITQNGEHRARKYQHVILPYTIDVDRRREKMFIIILHDQCPTQRYCRIAITTYVCILKQKKICKLLYRFRKKLFDANLCSKQNREYP